MLETRVKHGDVCIDLMSDGAVRITRQSTMEGIHLSTSEWLEVLRIAEMHDMPAAPPYVAPCPAQQSGNDLPISHAYDDTPVPS
jgi:hypothetical protein